MSKFIEEKFLANVQKRHLKSEEMPIYSRISDVEVRKTLDKFVEYDNNPRFSAALDEICANIVGITMFKLLMAKMTMKKRTMKIEELKNSKNGSSYYDDVVYINFDFYESNGMGISSRKYFYINRKGEIETKLKSLTGSMFHEFCHALHDVSGTEKLDNILCKKGTDIEQAWDEDEELRTITCFEHDPVCDHCFDFVQSILKSEQFHPRYSHRGWEEDRAPQRHDIPKLYHAIPASKKYMDGWREYVI
jgi:hypothetical protein